MTDHSNKHSERDVSGFIKAAASDLRPTKEPLGERTANCDHHGSYISSGMRYLGFQEIWSRCGDCEKHRVASELQAEVQIHAERNQARVEAMLGRAAIPKRFMGRRLENFVTTSAEQNRALSVAVDYAANLRGHVEKGDSLVFSGAPGTGKSHLAIAIQQAGLPNVASLYVTCSDVIRTVRSTWNRDSERSEIDVLRAFGTVELLVIDEVGVMGGTENEKALLFEILDKRYRDLRPTILLTNLDRAGFKSYVGDRVFDRLTETAKWISFDWLSYRTTARTSSPSNEPQFDRTSQGT
ncbi:MAG: ATP-binding protein [Pseudomonadota bacterium]